jgi:hypothetical protein
MRSQNVRRALLPTTLLLLIASFPSAQADEYDAAASVAELIIRQATVKCLAEKEMPVKSEPFSGKVTPVDPEKNVEVDLFDFDFVPGRVSGKYELTARFAFSGSATIDKTAQKVEATADVDSEVSFSATYREENGGIVVRAKVDKIEDVAVKIRDLKTADAASDKAALEKLAAKAMADHADTLVREANAWLQNNTQF